MKKNILLTLRSVQTAGGESSETELITDGIFSTGKNGYSVKYIESEATGFEGSDTVFTCKGNEIATLNRSGSFNSQLMLEVGKKHFCYYNTPFGDMVVGITTNSIKNDLSNAGGKVYISYSVDINSGFLSDNEIFIDISVPEKKENAGKECS